MFFSLSKMKDLNFSSHMQIKNGWWLNLDAGWRTLTLDGKLCVVKGYLDNSGYDIVCDVSTQSGNMSVFEIDEDITFKNDAFRGFPLYFDQTTLTLSNFYQIGERIDSTESVKITSRGCEKLPVNVRVSMDMLPTTLTGAIDYIDTRLKERFLKFANWVDVKPKFFFSGGIDTLVCWSYLKNLGIEYDLLVSEHIHNTLFTDNCLKRIRNQYWAYSQIHSFDHHSVIVSGAMGDEVLMRSPLYGDIWLKAHGSSYLEILKPTDYHYYYHTKLSTRTLYESTPYMGVSMARETILNMVINDHQHWHLDNTLTFTPFKDLAFTQALLNIPLCDLMGQLSDAQIGKELVARRCPEMLMLLESQKNKIASSTVDRRKYLTYA